MNEDDMAIYFMHYDLIISERLNQWIIESMRQTYLTNKLMVTYRTNQVLIQLHPSSSFNTESSQLQKQTITMHLFNTVFLGVKWLIFAAGALP